MNVERPRRLVVYLNYYDTYGTIDTDRREWKIIGLRYNLKRPSPLIRFATRLGLTKDNKQVMDVVTNAYVFVSDNYRQGDQVDMFSSDYAGNLDAAEILAKHLHNGTRPGNLSGVRSKDGRNMPLGRMSIHCVVVQGLSEMTSISEWNNKLKSRFPSGIRYIVCWEFENGFRSCATRCDMNGSMVSRQICVFKGDNGGDNGGNLEMELHCNQDIIYYLEPWFYDWNDHEPVWMHKLDSSRSDVQGGLPLEATKPVGMFVHELRKYQGLPGINGEGSMLVWKSYRSEDERA